MDPMKPWAYVGVAFLVSACADSAATRLGSTADGERIYAGDPVPVGDGYGVAFVALLPTGRPTSLGVELTAPAMEGLPTAFSDRRACFDKDGDGALDQMAECVVGHEYILDVPDQPDLPFRYVMLNYNPMGHIPPGVYDRPHFDVHFYIQGLEAVRAIDAGPCPVLVDCDDYAVAKTLVPEAYVPAGFVDVDAVEPMMGNHLVDVSGPEFSGEPFTRTFIFGAYGGEVTFYEPMLTREWLLRRTRACDPIPQPQAWAVAGWYPTRYCTDFSEGRHRVTMEEFVYRSAASGP